MNFIAKILKFTGSIVPAFLPRASGIGNRLLKPIYNKMLGPGVIKFLIWDNIFIEADPTECIGGNLFFGSHVYDLKERRILQSILSKESVFLDIGANIGAYSLWASKFLNNKAHIIAIEADPVTFNLLNNNLNLNNIDCKITLINEGVSDCIDQLQFYRNKTSNLGGNSFINFPNTEAALLLNVSPLYNLINQITTKIDVIKIDIEGFELPVLTRYFLDCFEGKPELFAKYIMIEMDEGPLGDDNLNLNNLKILFSRYNYKLFVSGKNSVYKLI
jgi:FkbM family methyltransferase